jgi:hypothetical protein
LEQAWAEWVQYRAELGKPLTPTVEVRHRNALSDNPVIAVAQLRTAIERGWSGPARADKLATAPAAPESKADRDRRVCAERRRLDEKYGPREETPRE